MSTSSNFNLRNMAPNVMLLLKKKAAEESVSVNTLILQILEQGLGVTRPKQKRIYHDLDHLAGTWSKQYAKEFNKRVKSYEKIDKEMWL